MANVRPGPTSFAAAAGTVADPLVIAAVAGLVAGPLVISFSLEMDMVSVKEDGVEWSKGEKQTRKQTRTADKSPSNSMT